MCAMAQITPVLLGLTQRGVGKVAPSPQLFFFRPSWAAPSGYLAAHDGRNGASWRDTQPVGYPLGAPPNLRLRKPYSISKPGRVLLAGGRARSGDRSIRAAHP